MSGCGVRCDGRCPAGGVRQERNGAGSRRRPAWWWPASGRGGGGDGQTGRCGAGDRVARPGRSIARRTGEGTRSRHRAQAAVQGRQRCQGRSAALFDRQRALPGNAAERTSGAGPLRSQPVASQRHGGPLQTAGGGERHQPPGLRQCPGRAKTGTGRRAGGPRRCGNRKDQPGLCQCHGADFRAHRPLAGHRGRPGWPGRSDAIGGDSADQSGVCEFHAVSLRSQPVAQAIAGREIAACGHRRSRQRPDRAGGWRHLSAAGQVAFFRAHGRSDHRPGHAARQCAQRRRAAVARPLRKGAHRAGAGGQRRAVAAAGGYARFQG